MAYFASSPLYAAGIPVFLRSILRLEGVRKKVVTLQLLIVCWFTTLDILHVQHSYIELNDIVVHKVDCVLETHYNYVSASLTLPL